MSFVFLIKMIFLAICNKKLIQSRSSLTQKYYCRRHCVLDEGDIMVLLWGHIKHLLFNQ